MIVVIADYANIKIADYANIKIAYYTKIITPKMYI
jgi:hypothetical protein